MQWREMVSTFVTELTNVFLASPDNVFDNGDPFITNLENTSSTG